jgi:hypothetical protein
MKTNKVSRKGMPVTKFTQEQMSELLTAIKSNKYNTYHAIATAYAEKFNKSRDNVYQKVRRIAIKNSEEIPVKEKARVQVKRSRFFYTDEEIQQLKDSLNNKEFKTDRDRAKLYAEKLDRTLDTVYSKLRELSGKKIRNKAKPQVEVAKIEVIQEVKPLTLPQGMTYQGTAKKVELHADHFRVYF